MRRSLGDILSLAGLPGGAAWAYSSSLAARQDAETWLRLGTAHVAASRWGPAAAAFTEAVRLRPAFAEALGGLMLSLHRSGRVQECLAVVERFAVLCPHEAEPLLLQGSLLLRMGRKPEGLRAFRTAASLPPPPRGRVFVLGEALLGRRAWDLVLDRHRAASTLGAEPSRPARSALLVRGMARARALVTLPLQGLRALLAMARRSLLLRLGGWFAAWRPHVAIRSYRAALAPVPPAGRRVRPVGQHSPARTAGEAPTFRSLRPTPVRRWSRAG